jgi:hypothetical protein
MLQTFETSFRPAMMFPTQLRPAIAAVSDSDGASLGRRLPRFEKAARAPHGPAMPGATFLDHLRGFAAHDISRR